MSSRQALHIAVGSENRAKNKAVEKAFQRAFPDCTLEIEGIATESGVAEQPMSAEESIHGAINRARNALAQTATADFGVGLEGGVETIANRMFLHGWVAIIDRNGTTGVGHSSGIELPGVLQNELENGRELGPALELIAGDDAPEIRQTIGTNGLITNGLYTREQEFVDAVTAALARFVRPELYR